MVMIRKTARKQTGSSPLGEVRERSVMITCLTLYTLHLCIFNLSPAAPKGEKRFDLLIKKQKPNGDDTKDCTEANWPILFMEVRERSNHKA